jgi:hypothetical protein
MRFTLTALALCAIALPASAQRVDTRRYDIEKNEAGVTSCQFRAVDGLTLWDLGHSGADNGALWQVRATGHEASETDGPAFNISLDHEGGSDVPHRFYVSFSMPEGIEKLAFTRLFLDDRDVGGPPTPVGSGDAMAVDMIAQNQAALLNALPEASVMRLDLYDAKAVRIESFSFEVIRFRRIAELLDLVHWQCQTPDRG